MKPQILIRIGALALAVLLGLAPVAFAQSSRGDIQGTVTDDNGEAMVGVTVTATSPVLAGFESPSTAKAPVSVLDQALVTR